MPGMILACCVDGGLFDALLFGLLGGPAALAYLRGKLRRKGCCHAHGD